MSGKRTKTMRRTIKKQVSGALKEMLNSLMDAPLKVRLIVCYRILIKRRY